MVVLKAIAVALGMYSKIPMPQVEWDEESMRYAMCAFPLVGVAQASLCFLWGIALWLLGMPPLVAAAGLTLIPLAVNGGIHLDGLADTADAVASHGSRDEKLQIMKDPHIGAFGVIALIAHMLLTFSLYVALPARPLNLAALLGIFTLSRALSALSVVRWPAAKKDGTARSFHDGSAGISVLVVLIAEVALSALTLVLLKGLLGITVALAAGIALAWYWSRSKKQFGGVTGDLAGWFLQTAELFMLATLVLGECLL